MVDVVAAENLDALDEAGGVRVPNLAHPTGEVRVVKRDHLRAVAPPGACQCRSELHTHHALILLEGGDAPRNFEITLFAAPMSS